MFARRCRTLPLLLALSVCLGIPALAPEAAFAQAGDDATYKQHMTNGVKLYQDKNWEAAIAEFEAAYRVRPKASPLVNIALCHKGMFRYPQAIATLEKALAKHADTMSDADKKAAQDAIAELRALLGHVTLKLVPPNATVSVDGEDLAKDAATRPIPLGPGSHKIRARAEGYGDAEAQVAVASGDKGKVVELTLVPDKGYVSVVALHKGHAIAIDQKPMGYGKWTGFLSPGTHLVQIYKPGGSASFSQQIVVAAGKLQDVKEGDPGMMPSFVAPPGLGDTPREPEKPPPDYRGFYGFGQAGVFTVVGKMTGDAGYALGARAGWRPHTVVGLEAMFQYATAGNLSSGTTSFETGVPVELDAIRVGGNVRLMTRGRVARFVGTLGGGLAIDWLNYDASRCEDFAAGGRCFSTDNSGPGFYVNTEVGMEFDFSGLFFGLALQNMFSSLGGVDGPELGDVQGHVGLHLRLGYGTW